MSKPPFIPTAVAVPDDDDLVPSALPVDLLGQSLIPELLNRSPTHNESVLISGATVALGSTNVKEMWWVWGHGMRYDPKLFVRFLDGSLYVYYGADLTLANAMMMAGSHGRFVWNVLRIQFQTQGTGPGQYQRLVKGPKGHRARPQVVRAAV